MSYCPWVFIFCSNDIAINFHYRESEINYSPVVIFSAFFKTLNLSIPFFGEGNQLTIRSKFYPTGLSLPISECIGIYPNFESANFATVLT